MIYRNFLLLNLSAKDIISRHTSKLEKALFIL